MGRFVEGLDRSQTTLFPECLDDWIEEDNPVRVIDAFVDSIDLGELGFDGVVPETTGRPAYHPAVLLKLYIYGYLNRVQSSRRLEREAGRNVEVMWLMGRLVPDHKTIADFRKDNGREPTEDETLPEAKWEVVEQEWAPEPAADPRVAYAPSRVVASGPPEATPTSLTDARELPPVSSRADLVDLLQPDVYVKGGDYTPAMLPEAPHVQRYGGEVRILPYVEDRSTTSLIARIRA